RRHATRRGSTGRKCWRNCEPGKERKARRGAVWQPRRARRARRGSAAHFVEHLLRRVGRPGAGEPGDDLLEPVAGPVAQLLRQVPVAVAVGRFGLGQERPGQLQTPGGNVPRILGDRVRLLQPGYRDRSHLGRGSVLLRRGSGANSVLLLLQPTPVPLGGRLLLLQGRQHGILLLLLEEGRPQAVLLRERLLEPPPPVLLLRGGLVEAPLP